MATALFVYVKTGRSLTAMSGTRVLVLWGFPSASPWPSTHTIKTMLCVSSKCEGWWYLEVVHNPLSHSLVQHFFVPLLQSLGLGDLLVHGVAVEDVVVPLTGWTRPDVTGRVAIITGGNDNCCFCRCCNCCEIWLTTNTGFSIVHGSLGIWWTKWHVLPLMIKSEAWYLEDDM